VAGSGGVGAIFFTVPNLQKPKNQPLEPNTKWGHVGKKRVLIFKSGLFWSLPPQKVCMEGPISLHDLSGWFGQVVRVLLCHC